MPPFSQKFDELLSHFSPKLKLPCEHIEEKKGKDVLEWDNEEYGCRKYQYHCNLSSYLKKVAILNIHRSRDQNHANQ